MVGCRGCAGGRGASGAHWDPGIKGTPGGNLAM